ncbi:MAG TPA: DUF2254 family protein [Nannocystis sp.]
MTEPRKPAEDDSDELAEHFPVAASSLMAMRLTPEMRRVMQATQTKSSAKASSKATMDGLPRPMPQYKLSLRTWSIPVLAILGLAVIIFVVAFWLNIITDPVDSGNEVSAHGLLQAILFQDVEQARNTLNGLGEVMAAVLGLALTVSSIIVQLAATRFTPHITSLFFRARTNLLVLGFFVTATVFVVWVNFSIGATYVPRWGVLFSMLLMTASLLLLFPYFAYVFDFLDPEKIVGRITANGLYACTPIRGKAAQAVDRRQLQSIEAVEHLTNIGLNALQQKDKNIASNAIDALCNFAVLYGETKAGMLKDWHRVSQWNRQSPDFVSLSTEAILDLSERGTWLEWKILRQYQMIFGEGLTQIKDVCYLIAIDTRRLGEAAARRGDLHALDLAIKFFNTYLRATFNANDIRTAYNTLHQYRQLGEMILAEGRNISRTRPSRSEREQLEARERADILERRAVDIARYMRYYSGIAFQRGMIFIAEVIAHDIGTLCAEAHRAHSACHQKLLDYFLAVDDVAESAEQQKALSGVRLAQIKLATNYLLHGAVHFAKQIADDMAGEDHRRLRGMWQRLVRLDIREFWEVNDRGVNFEYLPPEQKALLPRFFAWFEGLRFEQPEDEAMNNSVRLHP